MATILDLLMALNRDELPPIPAPARPMPMAPAPTGNVPEYGGPSQVTEPPQAPLDTRIIQQMLALGPSAPTAPAPLSRGQRIANALIGFGAGVQGYGPQFLQQLQEPQREYQRQLSAYNNQRSGIALQGLETAQRQQEQKTRRAQEVSDREFEAEVRRETRRLNLTDQREIEMFRDTLLARRQREDDERAAEEMRRREKAQRERDAIKLEGELITKDGAPSSVAKEIARRTAGLSDAPLSAAAEKWRGAQAKLADAKALRLARIAAGGAGGAGKTPVQLVDANGNVLGQMPYSQLKFSEYGQLQGFPEGTQVRFPQAQQQTAPSMPPDPFLNLVSESGMLSQGMQPQQGAATFTKAEVRAYARKNKQTVTQVEAAIKAKGGIVK